MARYFIRHTKRTKEKGKRPGKKRSNAVGWQTRKIQKTKNGSNNKKKEVWNVRIINGTVAVTQPGITINVVVVVIESVQVHIVENGGIVCPFY